MNVPAILRRVFRAKGDLRRIRFREGERSIECYVPDDCIWSAVKGNLILREYERQGVDLGVVNGTVIDAGAHAGLFALRVAAQAEKVFALEPNPQLLGVLRMNLLLNNCHSVEVLSKALWVDAGEIDLIQGEHSGETSLFGTGQRISRVRAITLEKLVDDIGAVELLKLDIEGAEFPVLLDCPPETLAQVSTIVAELHLDGRASMLPGLVRHLQSCGFRVVVRESPIHYWRESISQTLETWKTVDSLTTLKLAVVGIYSMVALGRILSLPVEPDASKLKFLFAIRAP